MLPLKLRKLLADRRSKGPARAPYLINQQIDITSIYFQICKVPYTNARIKSYPRKAVIQVASKEIFPTGEPEPRGYSVSAKGKAKNPERAQIESKRRAVTAVRDIALNNFFTHMFTLTLDPKLIDRYDTILIRQKLRAFLSNMSQRYDFAYIIVPEYHTAADEGGRRAVHFHGLCILGNMEIDRALSPKGKPLTDQAGRPVYNMSSWKWGFSTCVELDEHYEKAVSYILKYILKDDEKILGKWYLSSRSLKKKPEIIPLEPISYSDFRDEAKLNIHIQNETEIYPTVRLITEELPQMEELTNE